MGKQRKRHLYEAAPLPLEALPTDPTSCHVSRHGILTVVCQLSTEGHPPPASLRREKQLVPIAKKVMDSAVTCY